MIEYLAKEDFGKNMTTDSDKLLMAVAATGFALIFTLAAMFLQITSFYFVSAVYSLFAACLVGTTQGYRWFALLFIASAGLKIGLGVSLLVG